MTRNFFFPTERLLLLLFFFHKLCHYNNIVVYSLIILCTYTCARGVKLVFEQAGAGVKIEIPLKTYIIYQSSGCRRTKNAYITTIHGRCKNGNQPYLEAEHISIALHNNMFSFASHFVRNNTLRCRICHTIIILVE